MLISSFAGLTERYGTVLIDPPWRFANRTGKMAPEHNRLRGYGTMSSEEIAALPARAQRISYRENRVDRTYMNPELRDLCRFFSANLFEAKNHGDAMAGRSS